MRIIVVGAGVGGLTAAIALARQGHQVTVLERDDLPDTHDPDEAFAAPRQGVPQSHQTHGFLARIVVELREHLPDVLDALLAAGCVTLPTTANLGEPQPGDEDLRVLVVRRTTFEWVLRQAALREPRVAIVTDAGVQRLMSDGTTVTGVMLDTGTELSADAVIAATGRRGPIPQWLAEIGVDVPETVYESGLMYLSRWYRLGEDDDIDLDPKLGGDLGFVKYLAVPGDGRTLSVTLAIPSADGELRAALSDPDGFDHACRLLPGPSRVFEGRHLEPIGGVRPMGGLLNRIRRFTDDNGEPTVLGFHVVGDAHTVTNPLYGRGCSLAVVMALRLAAGWSDDGSERARRYEAACRAEIEPWFEASVQMDKLGADPVGVPKAESNEAKAMARVFAAAQTDPVIGRATMRLWNLLSLPSELMSDAVFVTQAAHIVSHPDDYPIPPREGPSRTELLAALRPEAA